VVPPFTEKQANVRIKFFFRRLFVVGLGDQQKPYGVSVFGGGEECGDAIPLGMVGFQLSTLI
jgi:hypothetical protein